LITIPKTVPSSQPVTIGMVTNKFESKHQLNTFAATHIAESRDVT